jgi:hypothetical protein
LQFDATVFRRDYDRRPFLIEHSLASHPLFQLAALSELAKRLALKGNTLHRLGDVPVNSDFDHAYERYGRTASLGETLMTMERAGSFVVINYPEDDPEYAPVIRRLYDDIRVGSEPIDPNMLEIMAYVFISSPGALTPYHMDREQNFLLQIQGDKTLSLWDPRDRRVMSERDVELLMGDATAPRPGYSEQLEPFAQTYQLVPGLGVHHPFIAPHVARTGSKVSISLALTFRTRGTERRIQAYQVNHLLRRLHLAPRPIGQLPLLDDVKGRAYGGLRGAKNLIVRRSKGSGRTAPNEARAGEILMRQR